MKIEVFRSIRDVPASDWDKLVGNANVTHSRAFWQVVEQAGLNDFEYRHVLFYNDEGLVVALTSVYTVTTDVAIFAGARLKSVLGRVRRLFPNFLRLRMLECGTPITLSAPLVASAQVPVEAVVDTLHGLIRKWLRRERQWMVVFRDFEPGSEAAQQHFRRLGYPVVDALPNTYLDVRWDSGEAYRGAMKSYFRSKLRKHLRINQQRGTRHELHHDFAGLADRLCEQWLTVYAQADEYQREVLTPAFYRELSTRMPDESMVLLFFSHDQLIGHAVLLLDGDLMRWLYFGRTEAANDSLYLYVAHAVIETAIQYRVRRLAMGVTTYPIKRDLGAEMTPMRIALGLRWSFANPLVGLVYPLINHVPGISNKQVFKA